MQKINEQPFSFIDRNDWILYSKIKPQKIENLTGKVVAVRNPYTNKIIFRKVIATEFLWVRRYDDMGLI